ncbi:MAG: prephenate dehydratase domain-containing protein, partial [Myxococcota bacterium]
MTTDEESSPVSLDDLRHQIDSADRAMLEALRSRLDAVREVAARKQGSDAPIRDQRREDALQARWASLADEAGLNPHSVGRLLREVLSWSRREQESAWRPSPAQRVRVAFQGTSGAHSDLAANELMVIRGTPAMTVGKPTFEEVLQALWDGHVHYAFLPVENSIVGGITAVHTLLMEGRAHIVDEESWDVHHALSVLPGTDLSTVRTVSSHPVALRQCRRTLTETLGLTVQEVWDTAGAARAVALGADPTRAAVCSPEAAKMNGLHVLRENVSDHPENRTRFLLLAREPEPIPPGVQARTTFRLVADHQPGSLARCLGAFADHDVNLSGLVSLMLPRRPGQYGFLVDIEGHADDERVARALVGVRAAARQLTILGTYPDRTSDRKASIRRSPTAPAAEARAEAIGSGSKSTDAVPEKAATTEGAVLRNEAPAQDKSSGAPSTKTAQGTRIYALGDVRLGGDAFVLIAGPGRVQHIDELQTSAALVQRVGGALLRVDVTSSHAASSDLVSLDELV